MDSGTGPVDALFYFFAVLAVNPCKSNISGLWTQRTWLPLCNSSSSLRSASHRLAVPVKGTCLSFFFWPDLADYGLPGGGSAGTPVRFSCVSCSSWLCSFSSKHVAADRRAPPRPRVTCANLRPRCLQTCDMWVTVSAGLFGAPPPPPTSAGTQRGSSPFLDRSLSRVAIFFYLFIFLKVFMSEPQDRNSLYYTKDSMNALCLALHKRKVFPMASSFASAVYGSEQIPDRLCWCLLVAFGFVLCLVFQTLFGLWLFLGGENYNH